MSLYKRGRTWHADITVPGAPRFRGSSGTDDRAAAQEWHDRKRAQLWRQAKLGERPAVSATWEQAAALWLSQARRTAEDGYRLRWLSEHLQGLPVASLTAPQLEDLLQAKASSAGSYNRYVTILQGILRAAHDHGWIAALPRLRRRKEPSSRIRWLTPAEWKRLERALPSYLRQLARLALATGLRENNVLQLEWSQLDLERRVAWIHADQAKTRSAIGVPLNDQAIAVLRLQLRDTGGPSKTPYVFPGPTGKPLYKASNRKWYAALREANLVGFRWHDLRHTWASWHVQNGTRLDVLRELGGWKTLSMVQRYAHLAPEHLAAAAGNVFRREKR